MNNKNTATIIWEKTSPNPMLEANLLGRVNHVALFSVMAAKDDQLPPQDCYELEYWFLPRNTQIFYDIDKMKAAAQHRLETFMKLAGFVSQEGSTDG